MNALADWLIAAAGRSAAGLLVWSWQALVLMACVGLGMKVCRLKMPALRHQVWLFGLMAVALLPLCRAVAESFPALRPASPTLSYVIEAPRAVLDFTPKATPPASPAAAPPVAAASSPVQASVKPSIFLAMLFAVWVMGVLIALSRLVKIHMRLRRAVRGAQTIRLADLDCAESEALIAGKVSLRLSPEVHSPILFGLFRPVILLPSDIASWTTPAERSAMIRHEFAHVERRDTLVSLFQAALHSVFFFHPLVRYGCRQLCLEREMACDDRVVALGAPADAYAEGILKVAERSITPGGAHQLALISAKQVLERRIEMILNHDRARLVARQWKYLIAPAGLIAIVAWMLIPVSTASPGQARQQIQKQDDRGGLKDMVVKYMGDSKAYDDLIRMALADPDPELRQKAVLQLTFLEGDGSTGALVELYEKSSDPAVKEIVIHNLGKRSEIEPLMKIAQSEPSPEFRQLAEKVIGWLKETSDSKDIKLYTANFEAREARRNQGAGPQLPPPPPPHPATLTVSADAAPSPRSDQSQSEARFALLREAVYAHMRRDASVFERILADDYIGTGPDGAVFNKEQEIAQIPRFSYPIKKFEFDEYTMSGDEQMGVANFLGTVYFEVGGAESTVRFRYTVTFAKRQGQWKVLAIHMSNKQ
jgi:beta-lactamase regulating signal transducer with metallopeptidase domain